MIRRRGQEHWCSCGPVHSSGGRPGLHCHCLCALLPVHQLKAPHKVGPRLKLTDHSRENLRTPLLANHHRLVLSSTSRTPDNVVDPRQCGDWPQRSLDKDPEELSPDRQGVNTGNTVEVPGMSALEQSHPFLKPQLDCNEEQAADPKRLLQHCFMAIVTTHDIPGSPEEGPVPNLSQRGPAP
ncbi:protein shisa-like-2A isoform X3 [Rhinolophus sinicus]|uniref:protein shisa-like-2A isoform X3 n=1 Tax=Rhinolophus sinicus TaxID=89399 RepID=UPI003D7BBF5E